MSLVESVRKLDLKCFCVYCTVSPSALHILLKQNTSTRQNEYILLYRLG